MKRKRFSFEETADVLVGNDQVRFTTHTNCFRLRSSFFASEYLKKCGMVDNPIKLPEEDPEIFNEYLRNVYGCELKSGKKSVATKFTSLARVYILAEKLGDLQSANEIVDEIIRFSEDENNVPDSSCVTIIMAQTTRTSPLRQLMIDIYAHEASEEVFVQEDDETLPHDFLLAVSKEMVKLRDGDTSKITLSDQHKCHYHQHDASCPQCKDETDSEPDDDSKHQSTSK